MTPVDEFVNGLVARIADAVAERINANVGGGSTAPPWRLLSAKEAGELLGRSERWVHAASNVDGDDYLGLPYVIVGDRRMFDPDRIRAWAEARSVPADPDFALDTRWRPGRPPRKTPAYQRK